MNFIDNQDKLNGFCRELEGLPFIAIDLEFLREKTYYAQLCLIQVASSFDHAAVIDPLIGLDLSPFFALLKNPKIVKVFHSGRQDIEILYHMGEFIPAPLFDTQVAAMVCGFGESVSYETLVAAIDKVALDKTCRLTDWSRRPLDEKQLSYAVCDVTHLCNIYLKLKNMLEKSHRDECLNEEMAVLCNPETYVVSPLKAWQKIKHRSHNAKFLTVLRELAAWRELRAVKKDLPRQSVLKDDCLLNIVAANPQNIDELCRIRNIRKDLAQGKIGFEIVEALQNAKKIAPKDYVEPPKEKKTSVGCLCLTELLHLLLKIKSSEQGIVPRLIATDDDLRDFAADGKNSKIMQGWRYEAFGQYAAALKEGKLAVSFDAQNKRVKLEEKN